MMVTVSVCRRGDRALGFSEVLRVTLCFLGLLTVICGKYELCLLKFRNKNWLSSFCSSVVCDVNM